MLILKPLKNLKKSLGIIPFLFLSNPSVSNGQDYKIQYEWHNAQINAGGFISGIIFSETTANELYIRTDIGGAYRRDIITKNWIPLLDGLQKNDANLNGVLSIAIDPKNANNIYLATGEYTFENQYNRKAAILISNDKGQNFTKSELPFWLGGNENGRGTGERLIINPNKTSDLWLGTTKNGLWRSIDYGKNWRQAGFENEHILFTQINDKGEIYISTYGKNSGLFKSTNDGKSFTKILGSDKLVALQGKFNNEGHFIITCGDFIGPNDIKNGAVFKIFPDGTYKDISPKNYSKSENFGYSGLSIEKNNNQKIIITTIDKWASGDEILISKDSGNHWESLNKNSNFDYSSTQWLKDYSGGEIKHIGHWISDFEIDPFDANHALYVTGYGLWETFNFQSDKINWHFNNNGIEETAILDLYSPQNGASLISAIGDISGFTHWNLLDVNKNDFHKPFLGNSRSIDGNDKFITRTTDKAPYGFYSLDNGKSWQNFTNHPDSLSGNGGNLRISGNQNTLIWQIKNKIFFSNDFGKTWNKSDTKTLPENIILVSDKASDCNFYIYNQTNGELLNTKDCGKSFEPTGSMLTPWSNSIKSVSGFKDNLWAATYNGLYASEDGGKNFIKIEPFDSAWNIAFGKAAPDENYPSIFVAGKMGNLEGVFFSPNLGEKWILISNPKMNFSSIRVMEGDPKKFGRIYIGTDGRGIFYGDLLISKEETRDKK